MTRPILIAGAIGSPYTRKMRAVLLNTAGRQYNERVAAELCRDFRLRQVNKISAFKFAHYLRPLLAAKV